MIRNIFGPSQTEVFQALASELHATYREVEARTDSARGRIELSYEPWLVVLDVQESENVDGRSYYTRARAAFQQSEVMPFNLEVYRGDIFTTIGKLFGLQDIKIGDERFDKEFVIQGNQPEKVKSFMQNEAMRSLLNEQEHFHFKVEEKDSKNHLELPDGVGVVSFRIGGVITDHAPLKQYIELVKVTLDQLVAANLATKENPDYLI